MVLQGGAIRRQIVLSLFGGVVRLTDGLQIVLTGDIVAQDRPHVAANAARLLRLLANHHFTLISKPRQPYRIHPHPGQNLNALQQISC